VAVVPGLVESLGTPFRQLGLRCPDIAVEIHEMLSETHLEALEQRRIDVAIGGTHPLVSGRQPIGKFRLMDNPLDSAVFSGSHPLAGQSVVAVSDLAAFPFCFIDRSASPRFYDMVVDVLEQRGLSPDSRGRATGIHSLWRVVTDSSGWTIAPRSARLHPAPGTVVLPIAGLSIPWGFDVRWRLDDVSPVTAAVLDVIGGSSAA
jgi:DNA-binding transcriptional LysR family regulator